ncbi:MAG: MotA/TolQ/ExbB proton channel family protein [Gammaproteobacteria bacterium]|nr:MotA/TolQ/ExbB proton channel family protein [Gammaproteobacteria bacterium]
MEALTNNLFNIQLLLESGGLILWAILIASIVMWTLIMERYLFVYIIHPKHVKTLLSEWHERTERSSWYAHKIREGLVSESRAALKQNLMSIRTLIAALPMLGLLGTVDGMIQTFDVLTVFGTGNARGMAGGISIALITTMGGLLAALSGMYFSAHLEQRVTRAVDNVADALRRD